METFGAYERPFTAEERKIITKYLKYDQHVPLKIAEMVYNAEVEADYFGRAGNVLACISSCAFFFFPVVRQQPALRRIALSLIPGYAFHSWGVMMEDDLKWTKIYVAYQKLVQHHGLNSRLFM